jgi:hypothetical protein
MNYVSLLRRNSRKAFSVVISTNFRDAWFSPLPYHDMIEHDRICLNFGLDTDNVLKLLVFLCFDGDLRIYGYNEDYQLQRIEELCPSNRLIDRNYDEIVDISRRITEYNTDKVQFLKLQ